MRCSKQGHRKVEFAWNEECPICAGTVPPSDARESNSVPTVKSKTIVHQRAAQEAQDGFKGRAGSALSSLIPDWATNDRSGCSCKSYAARMDQLGVQWCNANYDMIVEHLVQQKKYLKAPLNMTPDAACRIGARRLLDKAIKMAS